MNRTKELVSEREKFLRLKSTSLKWISLAETAKAKPDTYPGLKDCYVALEKFLNNLAYAEKRC